VVPEPAGRLADGEAEHAVWSAAPPARRE